MIQMDKTGLSLKCIAGSWTNERPCQHMLGNILAWHSWIAEPRGCGSVEIVQWVPDRS